MLKILGLFLVALVVAVIALGALAYFRVIPIPAPLLARLAGSKPPEHSARYYPQDTLAYAWVSLLPSGEQLNNMTDIWERFNEFPAFGILVEETKEDFKTETGIDFDEAVAPWIGPDASAGFIDYDGREDIFSVAATVGVRDHDAAADFMIQWLEYMEASEGADFDRKAYGGFDTWVDAGDRQAYALSRDLLVFATNQDTLEEALDLAEGDGERSLALDEDFQAARLALPEERFFSVYVAARDAVELAETLPGLDLMGPPIGGTDNSTGWSSQVPDWLAASGGWVERGVALEMVAPNVAASTLQIPEIENPARLLPDDTLGYFAFGFDPDLERWRDELDQYALDETLPVPGMTDEINITLEDFASSQGISPAPQLPDDADLSDALDVALELARAVSGIDLEAEFFAHLKGELILAVSEFDFEEIGRDPGNNPVNAVVMLSHDEASEGTLRDTMGDLTLLVEEYLPFIAASREDVGADEDAVVFRIPMAEYAPGYVLHQGYLTVGSTDEVLRATVARQNGEGATLATALEHGRASAYLPGGAHFRGYVNLQSIMRQIEAGDIGVERDAYRRILAESLGVVAFSSSASDEQSRAALILTLFPD